MFRTSGAHVYDPAPAFAELMSILAPGFLPFVIGGVILLAGVLAAKRRQRPGSQDESENWKLVFCGSLALIPLLILYGVSVATPIHMFESRHCLVAVPGIALCWGLLIRRYLTPSMRLALCLVLAVVIVYRYDISSFRHRHIVTWKYALDFAEKNASVDGAPVVMCSSFPEADYVSMPMDSAKESNLFPQLSYYKLSVPVIPLPRALNTEAVRVGSEFLKQAAQKHERFLALGDPASYKTLDWLARSASTSYEVRNFGLFDETKVLEFTPRAQAAASRP
jgi:hypothetical protein